MIVGVLQGAPDLVGDPKRGVDRQLALAGQPLPERLAFGVGHDVIQERRHSFAGAGVPPEDDLAGVIEREDVGMLQRGGDLDLAEEPIAAESHRQLGFENLERDGAMVLEVGGEVDHGHAALAELALDPVTVADSHDELVEEVQGSDLLVARGNVEIGGRKRYMAQKCPPPRIGRRALVRVVTRRIDATQAARRPARPPCGARPWSCP